MKMPIAVAGLLVLMAWVCGYPKENKGKAVRSRSWWEIILDFSGITARPSEPQSGEVFPGPGGTILMQDLVNKKTRSLSQSGSYRTPVFSFDDSRILALRGDTLMAIDTADGSGHVLFPCPGLVKLVGTDPKSPDRILALKQEGPELFPGWISMARKDFTAFDFRTENPQSVRMLNYLAGWRRDYGDTVVEQRKRRVRIEGMPVDLEKVEVWADNQYLGLEALQGNDARHGQPSLSTSRRFLVMIRSPL